MSEGLQFSSLIISWDGRFPELSRRETLRDCARFYIEYVISTKLVVFEKTYKFRKMHQTFKYSDSTLDACLVHITIVFSLESVMFQGNKNFVRDINLMKTLMT